MRLTWPGHIDQVRRKASQRLGVLSPLLNKPNGLFISNGLMLYCQLIRPIMDYGCLVRRHAADSHLKRLQHVQSKCLCIFADVPWYISNIELHEDMKVPYIAEHFRNLAQSFDSKIPDAENLLVRQLGRYLSYPRDK